MDRNASISNQHPLRAQFHVAARSSCHIAASTLVVPPPHKTQSVAQVEPSVLPQAVLPKSGELKLGKEKAVIQKRPSPISIRVTEFQNSLIRAKAQAVGVTVNHFVLASTLGSNYRPPKDPELLRTLLMLNRELTAQGNNLNQLARQRNANAIDDAQAESMLDVLGRSLVRTLKSIREALSSGLEPEP